MYWRINCTEHLVLGVRADPTQEQSKEVKEAATSNTQPTAARLKDNGARLGRQRSITYSAGVGLNAGRRMAVPQTVDKKSTTDPTVVVRWAGTADGRLVAGITCQGIYLWTLRPFVQLSNLVYKSTEEFGSPVDLVWKHEEEEPMARYADYSDAQSGAVVATFFVVLSRGYVFEIAVYKRDNPVLEYEFSTQHYHVRGAGEGKGIPALGLAQKRTYRLPGSSSVVCAATTIGGYRQQQQQQEDDAESGSSALVATQSHVHRLAWTGTLVSSVDIKHIYDNPLAHIRQALCIAGFSDAATEIEVYLFSDGVIRTLTRKHRHGEGSSTLSPPPPEIRTLGAADSTHRCTVMAYTPASRLVAVGTTTGDVLLYSAAADNPEIARVGRIAFTHERGAQVSAIAWTPDGLALACGYTSGHVCVFSALGYELNITRLSATQSPRETHRNNEDGGGGVAMAVVLPVPAALVWMRGSTRLCVFSDCLSAMDGGTVLRHQQADVMPFARAASSTVACDGNTKRVCLFSDDKVFLNLCEFDQADQNQNQNQNQLQLQPELQWHVAHIPPEYIASNWPIRYVAADDDGRAIAVAGTHGVAWYSCDTQRWRMLRNQQQEEAITCVGGLLWYHNYLVVACINRECGDLAQLLFFARNRQLDMTSDMQTVVLEHPAATISCHNSNLLVLCRNNMLYQYAIFDDVDFIQVAFRRQIDLSTSGAPVVEPPRVRSLQWVPSALFDTRPAFLVHQGTTLMVVEELPFDEAGAGAGTGTGGAMDAEGVLLRTAVVSDQVEMTITSGVNFGNMHSTVWWFGASRLHACLISLEDFMDGGTGPLVSSQAQNQTQGNPLGRQQQQQQRVAIRVRPEFFPIAVSADKGMAIGIDQEDWGAFDDHTVAGLSRLPVRAKLYLHNILDHMLTLAANASAATDELEEEGEEDDEDEEGSATAAADQDALLYAACFEHLEFFAHAMEILLHEVLVREMDQQHRQQRSPATPDTPDTGATTIASGGRILPRVIALLRNFSSFYEIVVHCARKTEAAFWPHLFASVGGPELFFRQCLATGRLETATQCLLILQTLEPSSVNESNILALLNRAVVAQNKPVCLEVIRFLGMAAASDRPLKQLLERLHHR